jgi:hypothetical protein
MPTGCRWQRELLGLLMARRYILRPRGNSVAFRRSGRRLASAETWLHDPGGFGSQETNADAVCRAPNHELIGRWSFSASGTDAAATSVGCSATP